MNSIPVVISKNEFDDSRRPVVVYGEDFISPDKRYLFKFIYKTEYRFGDPLGYASLTNLETGIELWKYEHNNIRGFTYQPWSHDSKSVYFSTAAGNNDLFCLDIETNKLITVFRSDTLRTLNWVLFAPSLFNGLTFLSATYTGQDDTLTIHDRYIIYYKISDELIYPEQIVGSPVFGISDFDRENCIIIICRNFIYIVNIADKKIVGRIDNSLTKLSDDIALSHHYDTVSGTLYIEKRSKKNPDKAPTEYFKIVFEKYAT